MSAPVSGRFLPSGVRVGDTISRGTVLGTISAAPLDAEGGRLAQARVETAAADVAASEARLRAASAAADDAVRVYGRRERLSATGSVPQEELEQARLAMTDARDARDAAAAQLRAARSALTAARAVLDVRGGDGTGRTVEVRAPIGGVLLQRLEEHERVVPAGTPIAQVGDPAELELVIPVLTDDAARIRRGAAVGFTTGVDRPPLAATVTLVEPSAFTKLSPLGVQEQRVNVIARVDHPSVGLGDAFRIDARITVAEVRDAVIAPSAALVRDGADWQLWVIAGGRAERRVVQVGHRTPAGVEILAGLASGDQVVLYPPEALTPGARVTITH